MSCTLLIVEWPTIIFCPSTGIPRHHVERGASHGFHGCPACVGEDDGVHQAERKGDERLKAESRRLGKKRRPSWKLLAHEQVSGQILHRSYSYLLKTPYKQTWKVA